jgi:hypothetical protein
MSLVQEGHWYDLLETPDDVEASPLQLNVPRLERYNVPGQGTADCCSGGSTPSTITGVAAGLEPTPGSCPSFISTVSPPSRTAARWNITGTLQRARFIPTTNVPITSRF